MDEFNTVEFPVGQSPVGQSSDWGGPSAGQYDGAQSLRDDAAMDAAAHADAMSQEDALTLGEAIGADQTVDRAPDDAAEIWAKRHHMERNQMTAGQAGGDSPEDAQARQRAVDRAMGERIYAEREKTQRRVLEEHAPDLALAQAARQALGEQALTLLQTLAGRTAPGARLETTSGEIPATMPAPVSETVSPENPATNQPALEAAQAAFVEARADALTREANGILQSTGVNMVEVLRQDPDLRGQVLSGSMDLRTAYGYRLAREQAAFRADTHRVDTHRADTHRVEATRPRVPAAIRGGANRAGMQKSIENMSKAEFERLEEQLIRGKRVYMG